MSRCLPVLLLLLACGDDAVAMCPEGFARVDGVCVESTDAGPDAIVEDVGAEDASDAGPDVMLPCGMECSGMTPMCREADMTCVQCLTPADCAGMGDAVMCSEAGLCVECTENSHCDEAGASVCSTEGITAGSCVACTAGSATDCEGIAAGSICDDASGSGVCVECNAGDETACGANVCDVQQRLCTGMTENSLNLCEECVSDRQCMGDLACVQETFNEMPTGFRCTWLKGTEAPGPAGACSTVAPFIDSNEDVMTVGGELVEVCQLRTTTCASLLDYESTNCMTLDAEGDARCGLPGVDDGYCRVFDGPTNLCTHACDGPLDCLSGTCPVASPRVCVFPM